MLIAALSLAGCGHPDQWMPMSVGQTWTYQATTQTIKKVVQVKVSRELTVDSLTGYELSGPLGSSRMAWKHGTLVAETAANARFDPPMPLLTPNVEFTKDKQTNVSEWRGGEWRGKISSLGRDHEASADLVEQMDTVDLGTRKVPAILSTVTLHLPKGEIELKSWYQEGVGLIQQEQRTNGVRLVQLVLVGHK